MGSSAKTGKFYFRGSQEHFLHKSAIWDRTPPHLHIKCSPHVYGRVQGSQIFKWNSIISIRSKVMAVLVISWSPLSPHCPRHPHIVPIAPRRSPWSVVSVVSTCCPRGPHVVPTSSRRFPHHPQPLRYPPPTPLGGGGPRTSKNAIRFELIKIF